MNFTRENLNKKNGPDFFQVSFHFHPPVVICSNRRQETVSMPKIDYFWNSIDAKRLLAFKKYSKIGVRIPFNTKKGKSRALNLCTDFTAFQIFKIPSGLSRVHVKNIRQKLTYSRIPISRALGFSNLQITRTNCRFP